jgi:hypothetical protein
MGQSVILAEALTKQCGLDCAAQQGEPLSYVVVPTRESSIQYKIRVEAIHRNSFMK